jgi:hypothetical protein
MCIETTHVRAGETNGVLANKNCETLNIPNGHAVNSKGMLEI